MNEILDAIDSNNAEQVQEETWGHLRPEQDKTYHGHIIFARGIYMNSCCVVELGFKDIPSSPWFYTDIHILVNSVDAESSGLFLFKGSYYNGQFKGTARQIESDLFILLDNTK